jgi:hypothetical protein
MIFLKSYCPSECICPFTDANFDTYYAEYQTFVKIRTDNMHQYLTVMQIVEAWSLCSERPSDTEAKIGEEAG